MFEPIRGGTRGGQAEFKWSDVSADKDRENYLGHSINAPTGRWQKNKDVHWYNRDAKQTESERQAEIRRIKEAEEDALAIALGFAPTVRNKDNANAGATGEAPQDASTPDEDDRRKEKAEKRQRKLERMLRKEERRAMRAGLRRKSDTFDADGHSENGRRPERSGSPRSNSRSLSPPRRRHHLSNDDASIRYAESRSRRTPERRRLDVVPPETAAYDEEEREKERERDRRRWEANTRRDRPQHRGR